ncbi:MAG: hypothetical protein N3F05_00680 [Candidatus Diapherotrites archaeon]|nr:hypothetical protein [Candidatus Diapherotrites archaeon]
MDNKSLVYCIFALVICQSFSIAAHIDYVLIEDGNKYTNDLKLNVSIIANAEEICFSCDSESWTNWQPYSQKMKFLLTDSYGCNLADGNKTIYVKARDSNSEALAAASIILDRKAPTAPSNVSAFLSDKKANISWAAASDLSGIDYYVIKITEFGVIKKEFYIKVPSDETKYEHNALERRKYCYTVTAYDVAGNSSTSQKESCLVTSTKGPEFALSILDLNMSHRDLNGLRYFSAERVNVIVEPFDSNANIKSISGIITQGTETEKLSFVKTEKGFISEFELKSIDGEAKVTVTLVDELDLNSTQTISFFVDSKPPEINIISITQTDRNELTAKLNHSGDVFKIIVSFDKQQQIFKQEPSDSSKESILKINLNNTTSEKIMLHFTAFDAALNKAEIESEKIILLNAESKAKDLEKLAEQISEKISKNNALALLEQKEAEEELLNLKNKIVALKEKINYGDYETARTSLVELKSGLEQLSSKIAKISLLKSYLIDYDEEKILFYEKLKDYFKTIPTSTEKIWNSLAIKREVQILEINSIQGKSYAILIILSIKNTGSEPLSKFYLIDFIPEIIDKDINEIKSNYPAQINQSSKKISIEIMALKPNESTELKYRGKILSEDEFNGLKIEISNFNIPVPSEDINAEMTFINKYKNFDFITLFILILISILMFIFIRRLKR